MAKNNQETKQETISQEHLDRLQELNINARKAVQTVGELELDLALVEQRRIMLEQQSKETKQAYLDLLEERNVYAEELRKEYGDNISIDPNTGIISPN